MASSSIHKWRWALRRLRAMSPGEAVWRTGRAVRTAGDRTRHRLRLAHRPAWTAVADTELRGAALLFGRSPAYRDFLPAEPDGRDDLRMTLAACARPAYLRHTDSGPVTEILGHEVALEPGLDWNRDPATGRVFPLAHWSSIDHRRADDEAAIRRVWYLNRHQALPELALDYYLQGDEASAERACQLLDGWIARCPAESGVNWMIPLEIGLRLWSWAWTARLLAGSQALEHTATRLAMSVHQQAEHIRRHLAAYSSANNHLLVQGLGLLAAGIGFSGLYQSRSWREAGRHILLAELERQTHPDGVNCEQSRHYHELVLEIYLAAWLMLERSVGPLPARLRDRLDGMLAFLADLHSMPPGTSDIGDSDDQSLLPFAGPERPAQSLLALGATLYGRGDWRDQAGTLPRAAAVMLGAEGRDHLAALPVERPEPVSRLYRVGGYAILRDAGAERSLLFDCGPLGFLGTAAHGHADALALTLGAFGEPMLIDPGTYTYHAEPEWRDFFRSTAAHNTVRIDGVDQSEMLGPFLWGQKARSRLDRWCTSPAMDLVSGEHDGYRRLGLGVTHRRRVIFVKPDYIWVEDRLDGADEHLIEQFFHFPACSIRVDSPPVAAGHEIVAEFPGGAVLRLSAIGDGLDEADILVGLEEPQQGWRSPGFGRREPAPTLRLRGRRRLPVTLYTLLRPLPAAPPRSGRIQATVDSVDGGLRALRTSGMPGTDLCLLAEGPAPVSNCLEGPPGLGGGCELDGAAALVRWNGDGDPAGRPVTVAGAGLRRLVVGDRLLFESMGEPLSFSFRRLGDQAVWSGTGSGRIRLWAPGLAAVRYRGRLIPVTPDDDDRVTLQFDASSR